MISQHYTGIFLTMAEIDDRYIAYLQREQENVPIEDLMPMEPFEMVAVVGPFYPALKSGNRYIVADIGYQSQFQQSRLQIP